MKLEKGIMLMRTYKYDELRRYSLEGSDIVYKVYCGNDFIGVLGLIVGDIVYINLIEIDEAYRRQGYASAVIDVLKQLYRKPIHGFALSTSMEFWGSLGVEFVEEDDETGNVAMFGSMPFILECKEGECL